MSVKTLSTAHRDSRQWEKDSKLGGRLRRQAGTDKYKSAVPDPERPGRDLVTHFRAAGWEEARKLHAKRIVNVDAGTELRSSKTTLDDLAQARWLRLEGKVRTGEFAPGTLEAEKILYSKHLAPLGTVPVQKLAHTRISSLLAKLRREGYKASTIVRIYAVLRCLLNDAVREGVCAWSRH